MKKLSPHSLSIDQDSTGWHHLYLPVIAALSAVPARLFSTASRESRAGVGSRLNPQTDNHFKSCDAGLTVRENSGMHCHGQIRSEPGLA
jgi:hypothetical protein